MLCEIAQIKKVKKYLKKQIDYSIIVSYIYTERNGIYESG